MLVSVYKMGDHELFYGSAADFEYISKHKAKNNFREFATLFCAKDPFHKMLVGYSGNLPKDHPEYLVYCRYVTNTMALNMVDAPSKDFFSDEMIFAGLDFIDEQLKQRDVLVICNQGQSRSPTMCLMYMIVHGDFSENFSHTQLFDSFRLQAKNWNPNAGILQYCVDLWNRYREGEFL